MAQARIPTQGLWVTMALTALRATSWTANSVAVSTSLPNPMGTKNMAVPNLVLNLRDGLEMESEFVAVLKLVLKLVDVLNLMAETVGVLKLLERAAQGAGQMVAVLKLMDVPNLMAGTVGVLKLGRAAQGTGQIVDGQIVGVLNLAEMVAVLELLDVPNLWGQIVGVLKLLKLMDVLKLVLIGVVVVV